MTMKLSHTAAVFRSDTLDSVHQTVATVQVPPGCALAATGSFARGEMTPHSDLDLVLLIPDDFDGDLSEVWYPIWNSRIALDHSVRTTADCLSVLATEPSASLALLDLCHVSGDEELTAFTIRAVRHRWRQVLPRKFDHIADEAIKRWRRSGSCVSMTRPDLKNGHGGLRDIELLRALALGNLVDAPDLSRERRLLIDARTLLHTVAHRHRDVLDPEFAVDVADKLGFTDRYELSRAIAEAAHNVDVALTRALDGARDVITRVPLTRSRRQPVDLDVFAQGDHVSLARDTNFEDPGLPLRVAAAAARHGLRVSTAVWSSLRTCPPLPEPWPKPSVEDFFTVLSSPEHTLEVVRSMDRFGLFSPLVPEWERVRGLMPKEPTHIHTIDRHSIAVVENCASETIAAARPDLLLLAALFHDMGKRCGRPHAIVGAEMVVAQAQRMGFAAADVEVLRTLVLEHTTLAELATTTDVSSEDSVDKLLDAVHYDQLILNLLALLTKADARGTGPGVYSSTLAYGMDILVRNAERMLTCVVPQPPQIEQVETIEVVRRGAHYRILARIPNRAQLMTLLATVHASGLRLRKAGVNGDCVALKARPRFGTELDIQHFVQSYKSGVHTTPPQVHTSMVATYWYGRTVEVRAPDVHGILGTLLSVLPEVEWLSLRRPGATCIAQFCLAGEYDSAQIERDVTRCLLNG